MCDELNVRPEDLLHRWLPVVVHPNPMEYDDIG